MSLSIPFETALALLAIAYMASLMLLLAASNVAIAVIESLEEMGDSSPKPQILQIIAEVFYGNTNSSSW